MGHSQAGILCNRQPIGDRIDDLLWCNVAGIVATERRHDDELADRHAGLLMRTHMRPHRFDLAGTVAVQILDAERFGSAERNGAGQRQLLVRSASNPARLVSAIRREAAVLDPSIPVLQTLTMSDQFDNNIAQERMAATVRTPAGRALYARRKVIVEPVFGQSKEVRGCRRFLLRGLANIRGEWRLVCVTHHLRKIWRYGCVPCTC